MRIGKFSLSLQIFPYKYVHWDIHLKVQYLPWVDASLNCVKANKIQLELSFTIGEKVFVKSTLRNLCEFSSHQASLISINGTINLGLDLENLIRIYNMSISNECGQLPCVGLVFVKEVSSFCIAFCHSSISSFDKASCIE